MADLPARQRPSPRSWAWWAFLALAVVGLVVFRLLPDELPRDIGYAVFGVASAAGIVAGVRLHRPSRALQWYLMAAGQLIWSIADAVAAIDADLLGNDRFPSPADPIYLLGYPVVAAGLLLLIRGRRPQRDLAGFLDGALLVVALGLLSWVLLAKPTLATMADSIPAAVVALAYPLADIVLVAVVIRMVTTPGGRTPAYGLLVAAVALLILADTLASAFDMLTWESSDQLEVIWLASYALWAAAALHPSMAALSEPTRGVEVPFSRKGLVALAVAVLIAPGTLAVQAMLGAPLAVWGVVVSAVLTCVLVIARIDLSFRQLERAHAERERARAELTHQATHDPLTGLPNRARAMDLLRGALSRARRSGALVGVLFIDLDGFKLVNDTLGHQAGDEVLAATGGRMRRSVRSGDIVARLGGDEFVVLLEPLEDEASAVEVAERLVVDISEPIPLSTGREARIGASIGLAINTDSSVDADWLLQEADHAVYRAKASGRGRVEVFAPSLRAEVERRASAEAAIGRALQQGTATVRRSAIIELYSGRQVGAQLEASVPGPDGEVWTRQELLVDAQGTDTLCDLDAWVLRGTATQVRPAAAEEWFTMVPVTGRHLAQGIVLADIAAALERGMPAGELMLLVPADDVVDDLRVLVVLEQARRLGVRVCADSFGAGDSGTDRWANLPLDYVRLDRRLLAASVGSLLLRLTVETANAFGYAVIAPGIVEPQEADKLAMAGCELGLGPLYADLEVSAGGPVPGIR